MKEFGLQYDIFGLPAVIELATGAVCGRDLGDPPPDEYFSRVIALTRYGSSLDKNILIRHLMVDVEDMLGVVYWEEWTDERF